MSNVKRFTGTALAAAALAIAAVPAADAVTVPTAGTGAGTVSVRTAPAVSDVPAWIPRCRYRWFRWHHPRICDRDY